MRSRCIEHFSCCLIFCCFCRTRLPFLGLSNLVYIYQATLIATQPIPNEFPALPKTFFCRPAELVAPDLIGCMLVKRQPDGDLLWGVIVETEAYSQDDPACHGYRRRSPQN